MKNKTSTSVVKRMNMYNAPIIEKVSYISALKGEVTRDGRHEVTMKYIATFQNNLAVMLLYLAEIQLHNDSFVARGTVKEAGDYLEEANTTLNSIETRIPSDNFSLRKLALQNNMLYSHILRQYTLVEDGQVQLPELIKSFDPMRRLVQETTDILIINKGKKDFEKYRVEANIRHEMIAGLCALGRRGGYTLNDQYYIPEGALLNKLLVIIGDIELSKRVFEMENLDKNTPFFASLAERFSNEAHETIETKPDTVDIEDIHNFNFTQQLMSDHKILLEPKKLSEVAA